MAFTDLNSHRLVLANLGLRWIVVNSEKYPCGISFAIIIIGLWLWGGDALGGYWGGITLSGVR